MEIRALPLVLQQSPAPEGENLSTDWYPGLILVLAIFAVWVLARHFVRKRKRAS